MMDIIERKITLDEFKSHYHSLIPYVGIEHDGIGKPIFPEHGNWGTFPYDIDLRKCEEFSDLEQYFGGSRVSFLQLVEKYRLLTDIISKAYYRKKINKGGKEIVIDYHPSLSEKYSIEIVSSEVKENEEGEVEEVVIPYRIWGSYPDDSFNKNGGLRMLNFTLNALGFFIVDSKYIGDNYIPYIMCYTEINEYRRRMKKLRNSQECCIQDEFDRYGGEEFYTYLGGKLQEMDFEIDKWSKKIYIINDEPVSPELYLTLSLNADFHNIGIYSVLNGDEFDKVNHEKFLCRNKENSKLKYLRHSKVSYCEKKVGDEIVEEQLPFILVEDEERGVLIAKTPYIVGYAKNIQLNFNKFYGDLITSIVTGETEDEITYVMGAEILHNGNGWEVVDNTVGTKYVEKVPYKIYDYTEYDDLSYPMIKNGIEVNAFKDPEMIEGINSVKVYEIDDNVEVTSEFWVYNNEEMMNNRIIMEDYNFGKIETLVENAAEVSIDRGYVSAFELLYKMGEINTMDDIVNYSNNIFGI